MLNKIIQYKDNTIKNIFDEIESNLQLKYPPKEYTEFCKLYSNRTTSDISWLQICQETATLKCYKFALIFIYNILKQKLYLGDYYDTLYELLPYLNMIINDGGSNFNVVMCGDRITELIICKNKTKDSNFSYIFLTSKNTYIKSIIIDFLNAQIQFASWNNSRVLELLNDLLRLYVESCSSYYSEKNVSSIEYEKIKEKNNELTEQIHDFLLRNIDTENLRHDNAMLIIEITTLENRNKSLENAYEKIQYELSEVKRKLVEGYATIIQLNPEH